MMSQEELAKYELNTAFVHEHIQKTRALQRATDFVRIGTRAILLRGWSAASVCGMLAAGSRKPFEVIIPPSVQKIVKKQGDIVAPSSVFMSSKNVLWEGDTISFFTDDGILVNIDEFEYIQAHGINGHQFFAVAEDGDVESQWKALSRRSAEARKDKAVNILYLTFGVISWEAEGIDQRGKRIRVTSPLFLLPIKEDLNSKSCPKFNVIGSQLTFNPILARMLKTQRFIDLYEGYGGKTQIEFSEFTACMERIRQNIAELPDAHIYENDMHVCILDSLNEIMCQAAERNMDKIVRNELTSVFAQTADYVPKHNLGTGPALYPLPADDSQREVVERAIAGESLNIAAGPGTGKSSTIVNLVANLLIRGKCVCVMSEKAAANEVFVNYGGRCGLDLYCLVLNERTSVKEIVSQIKRLLAHTKVYVDAEEARAVISKYYEAVEEFGKLNYIYDLIPELGTNLYHIIGEGLGAEDLGCGRFFNLSFKNYRRIMQKLGEFQSQYVDIMPEDDWRSYLACGASGDEEQDEMLSDIVSELNALGVSILELIREKAVTKADIGATVKAQVSRHVADAYIASLGLKGYGNKKLKMLYKKLLEAAAAMQNVSAAYIQQELGRHISEAAKGSKFVELLDRLSTSRISLQDFFNTYGSEIVKLCPIIVSTPGVLVNYDKLNCFQALIIDESSQMPFANCLPFLIDNRQLVVFGDPLQLDITGYFTKSDIYEAANGEEFDLAQTDKSILHCVQGKLPGCQLRYHYRSKTEHLLTVSNARCYDGLLNVAPDIYLNREALPETLGYELIQVTDPKLSPKGVNLTEVEALVEKAIQIKLKSPEKVVGFITFNDKHQDAIYDEIERRVEEDKSLSNVLSLSDDALWVRTLENAQGKEADVICVCIGHARRRTNGLISIAISELCKEGALNRLNVLFTRAREKVIISISFDYKELRNADNRGIYRLYEYLHYAATGECSGITDRKKLPDKYNQTLVARIAGLVPDYDAFGRVGSDNMMVDIGLTHHGQTSYEVGMLLPSKALSPNTIVTKTSVLERAGWRILPLSPISCFTRPDLFAAQLTKDITEPVSYTGRISETFITDTLPPEPLTLTDFEPNAKLETQMTAEELKAEDLDAEYAPVWRPEVGRANSKQLDKMVKAGDLQARLRLIVLRLPQFIENGQLEAVTSAAQRGYQSDRSYCYLYAQLLRVRANIADESLIDRLLTEARGLGIKVA